jgi:two-component system, OmpR family, phosphate regulon sensor histidine kinase PhoR
MPAATAGAASIYQRAIAASLNKPELLVSPATLKAMVDGLLQLAIEQQADGLVWAKLPRSKVWWIELEHYAELNRAKGLYWLKNQRETDEDSGTSPSGTSQLGEAGDADDTALTQEGNRFTLQLGPDHPLRQEYFVLVWSEAFCGAIVGMRSPDQQLSTCYVFMPQQVKSLVQALETAIAPTESSPTAALIAHWQAQIATIAAPPASADHLQTLLYSHLQQQDELWQRSSQYRKQAEQAEPLRQQNEELLNTLRLKDEFLNNVGQELRTPLTTIKTALSLLASPSIKPPQRQRYLDLIAKECDRQSSLITSLLDLVQLERVAEHSELPPVNLNEVVPGVVTTYIPLAEEKGVRLGYAIPESLPVVACMPNWLKQIVINLVHNGVKFTPPGGQVWVRSKQQGDYVQLEVSDTGVGIAQSEIPKIFDRFYRVRQATDDSSGAGLGLTIVQQLLLHCGGSISVKSKLGEGSSFSVLLPVYRGATGE